MIKLAALFKDKMFLPMHQRMAIFYEACIEKGYTDIYDEKQCLKAKVVAMDMNLKYGDDIVAFYEKAKGYYHQEIAKLKEESEQRQKIQAQRAVDGERLVIVWVGATRYDVFVRPDGSFYYTIDKGHKIEGHLRATAKKGGVVTATYHQAEVEYTGVTVGGITTGGFNYTPEHYTTASHKTGTGDVCLIEGNNSHTISKVTVTTYGRERFRRDSDLRMVMEYDGTIHCSRKGGSGVVGTLVGSYEQQISQISAIADASRLPYDKCCAIAGALDRVLQGKFPPPDEQIYAQAVSLETANTSNQLKQALHLFMSISDYKDASQRAAVLRERYETVLQEEKEQKVLEIEAQNAIKSKKKKTRGFIYDMVFTVLLMLLACSYSKYIADAGGSFIPYLVFMIPSVLSASPLYRKCFYKKKSGCLQRILRIVVVVGLCFLALIIGAMSMLVNG